MPLEIPSRGQTVFEHQCAVCHSTVPEFHKEGPSLAGVYGRRAGKAPFFAGYKGLRGSIVWDERTLDEWLADPRALLGGKTHGDDPAARRSWPTRQCDRLSEDAALTTRDAVVASQDDR